MKKFIIFIFFALITISTYADHKKTFEVYDTYFLHLKSLEFTSAKKNCHSFDNKTSQLLLVKLSELLFNGGQHKNKEYFNTLPEIPETDTFNKAIAFLIKGYTELYYNAINPNAYSHFNDGYQIAKEIGYVPLQKQFILGVLELFHWEILQSNELYKEYLIALNNIATDDTDQFWHQLYTCILASKTIFEKQKLSSSQLAPLDSLFNNIKIKHQGILTKYYYEKAIYAGFDSNYKHAYDYYQKVIKNARSLPFMRYMVFGSFIRLSIIDNNEGFTQKALIKLDSAKNYVDKTDTLRSYFHIYRNASNYHYNLENYNTAYDYLKKSIDIEYELKYDENSIEISKLNIRYQTAEKEKQILIEQQKKKRNQNIAIALGGSLFLVSVITFLAYRNIKRKQHIAEQQREIEIQKTEKLLKEQELTAIDAMIAGQEKERQRLANDLHDNLGSTLATIKLHFQHLKTNRDNLKIQNTEELYTQTDNLLDEAYQKVRKIAHEKNSGVMANQGLLPAIKKLAKNISSTNQLLVIIHDYGLDERLDNTLEISIFRMIQELITNIIKHAQASEVHISFTNHDSLLNIIVEDNGKGFNAKTLPEKNGIGLKNIEKRIEHMEGTFEVDSTIGKGTNIIINIPI